MRSAESSPARIVVGINPVLELLRAHPDEVERIYVQQGAGKGSTAQILSLARAARVGIEELPREKLQALASGEAHQGVVAKCHAYQYRDVPDLLAIAEDSGRPPLIVVLDGIQDPQNLGAIIRSAHALGAHGVVIGKDRAAQLTPAVAKASAGAVEHCAVARVVNISRALDELKEAGLWSVAADPEGDRELPSAPLEGPLAIVIGAEGSGLREGVLKHCDFRVRIPMQGRVASLNASVSAALLLYEAVRQRIVRSP